MRIWKKAISAALSAALIASLTTSAAFAHLGAAGESDQSAKLDCTAAAVATAVTCAQVADGISTVTLTGEGGALAGSSLYISATGASIIGSTAAFVLVGGIVTAADASNPTGATITLRAPAAPGSAVVSVYSIATATGIATLEGTLTITFTATSGLDLSVANSSARFEATGGACNVAALAANVAPMGTNPAAKLCVNLKDGNGSAITANHTVNVTITPVGLAVPVSSGAAAATAGTAQATSTTANVLAGWYAFNIGGSGLAGTATIGISVTKTGGATTTFAPLTFTFTGPIASVTATNNIFAMAMGAAATADVVRFTAKDAAGNLVATAGSTAASSSVTILTTGAVVESPGTATGNGSVTVDCAGLAGAATVKVTSGGVTSNAVTVNCSDVTATVTVAFSAATIVPGGSATITVTAKDAGGRPVADGTGAALLLSSGAATPVTVTTNGMATATYLAPFNTGTVTALATVGGINGSGSASVSAPAPLPGAGSNASALGVTTAGPFSTTTKVAALGKYQTFKISYGAGAAGATVGILVATKAADGTWSAFTRLTGRVANASGDVYFYWKSSSASWVSVRGDLLGSLSNAVQGRWR
ncbi:MAG: hypothetical protein HW391_1133 [Chloroflexi bacterium]|nr:hypothetical protein [Chloroflexota bacterium]